MANLALNTHHTNGTSNATGGSISPRSTAYMEKKLLERAQETMVFERFGQAKVLPKKKTLNMNWRQYLSLAPAMTPLTEGIAPAGQALRYRDVNARLSQYGALIKLTDVMNDTFEDPLLNEMAKLAGEQAADTIEFIRYGHLCAGTNVQYADSAADRAAVISGSKIVTVKDLQAVERTLRRMRAKPITSIIGATANVSTRPVAASYFCVTHTDMMADIRALTGFIPVQEYGSTAAAVPEEFGSVGSFRFIATTYAEPIIETAGALPVYPILIFGSNAYGTISMQGKRTINVSVVNPDKIEKSDPLGQYGFVGWKTYSTTRILNDSFMVRLETTSSLGASATIMNYYGQAYLNDTTVNGLDDTVMVDGVHQYSDSTTTPVTVEDIAKLAPGPVYNTGDDVTDATPKV